MKINIVVIETYVDKELSKVKQKSLRVGKVMISKISFLYIYLVSIYIVLVTLMAHLSSFHFQNW